MFEHWPSPGRWAWRGSWLLIAALAAGCGSSGSMNQIELADVLHQVEQRNLACLGPVEPTNREISPHALAMATRLVRRTDEILAQIDRAAALAGMDALKRERLSRSLARETGHLPTGAVLAGAGRLRTDFRPSFHDGAGDLEYVALSEMGDDASEAGESADADARRSSITQPERGPLSGFGETVWRDAKRIHLDLWDDTKRVYGNATNVVILVTAGGASLALRPEVDDDIEDYYRDHHTLSEGWRDTFGVLGNPGFHFAMAGAWYLAGQQVQDAKTYEVGKTLFSALIINGVSTSFLKVCASTDGPNDEPHAWPSGHTSSAVTVAAVMYESYGPLVGVPLYGVAGMVGLARLDDREHHLSDVVFGAAMGMVIGHTVASGRRPQIFGGDLVPFADPTTGSGGLAWFKAIK